MLVLQTAYCLWWAPVVRHARYGYWVYPGDIWGTFRSAQFIGWGDLGGIYSASTALVTFPGILLLFAPVAMLCGALGLTESFPMVLPYPTAWMVLGPYEICISCSAIFACDALAERLGVGRARRALLCVVEGVVLWNVSVFWGHPEDALGIALAVYALVLAFDNRWSGAGWLFGAATATQPLVLLMLPVLLAMAGRQRVVSFVTRASVPALALLATPVIAQFHATAHALLAQPNYPNMDHVTPWTSLAPHLGGSGKGLTVAAGPGRVAAMIFACLLGWRARRWRHNPDLLVVAVALALASRCLTESVMVAYYAWPALAVALVTAAKRRWEWALAAAVAAIVVTVCSDSRLGEWPWWGIVNGGLVLVLLAGMPSRVGGPVPITLNAAGPEPVGRIPRFIEETSTASRTTEYPRVAG